MRISFFNYHYDIEGGARGAAAQIRCIARELERLGHQVDLQFRSASTVSMAGKAVRFDALKKVAAVRRYAHVPRLVVRNLKYFLQEIRLIRRFRPDVVLAVAQYCNLSPLLAARYRGIPCVLFTETPLQYEYSKFYTQYCSYPWIGRWIEGVSLRAADEVTCISEILKGYMVPYGVPAPKMHVIPNGADHRAFRPGPPDGKILVTYGLEDRKVIGFVGTFQFLLDEDRFIDMVETVCRGHPEAVFLLVGEGGPTEAIHRTCDRRGLSGHVAFTGAVPHEEVPRLLSVMEVVICPYRGDYLFYGSPLKCLEYMAAGKPVVAPALGQIKELIHDGWNGMLFDWDDVPAMVEKVLQLLKDDSLREELGRNARRTIEKGWTWEIQASRIARVLKKACDGKR